jgi:hypothetical protein
MANNDGNDDNNDIDILLVCMERVNRVTSRKTNPTYLATYRHFLKWLINNSDNADLHLETGILVADGPLTLTQHNVETYFQHAVLTMVGKKDAMCRKFNALAWFLKHVESIGTILTHSPSIQLSIENQQQYHVVNTNEARAGSDPHNGLKDVLSQDQTSTIIRTIYRHRLDSLDLAFSYLWGTNAAVRGSSSRKIVLCDLNITQGFGPDDLPPNNRTLQLILRKGNVHKDRHDSDRWVGVQRHVDYQKCTVFATGMLVLSKLHYLGNRLNFLRRNRGRCPWWDIPLNCYTSLEEETNAIKDVYKVCGISSCKVTHHRTQAVQYAGSRGLLPWQINTMTKHILDKQHACYQPECELQTMKVMSGFPLVSTSFYIFFLFYLFSNYLINSHLYM